MIDRLRALLADRLAPFDLSAADVLERDVAGGLSVPGSISANGSCRLFQARDGWLALNLARDEDHDLVPALTLGEGDDWPAILRHAAMSDAATLRDRAIELQLPVALVGEAGAQALAPSGQSRASCRVVDLSALWAGPLCAALLARAGAQVLRIESIGRLDPTPRSSPRLDGFLNGGKALLALDLRLATDRARLAAMIAEADVLVTSARAPALARLGLEPSRFPGLVWVAITAHGFAGEGTARVGFGDDCAAAGNLVSWHDGAPRFIGDALADPLTGVEAARAVLAGQGGVIDMAMARVAAAYGEGVA